MTRKRMLHAFRKRLVPEGQAPEQATPPAAREDELEKVRLLRPSHAARAIPRPFAVLITQPGPDCNRLRSD